MTTIRTSLSLALALLLVFAHAPVAFATSAPTRAQLEALTAKIAAASVAFAAPTAASFSTIVPANRQSAITLQGADPDGTALTYAIAAGPSQGALSGLNTATGVVVYTPVASYTGADSFTYTVTSGGDTTAAATVTLTVSNQKTRIIDSVVDSAGVPRSGKVTFILTQQVATPDGLAPVGSSVSASLSSGVFDISVFPSRSLSPNAYYQVWWSDASTTNKELLGVYDIPLSTSTVTLAAYKVMDTNLAARYTFASTAAVAALTTAVANATLAQLLSVSRTTGRVQKWDGGNLSDSIISESGSKVTVNGTFEATNITGLKNADLPTEMTGKIFNAPTINNGTIKTPTIQDPAITGTINGNQNINGNLNVTGKIGGDGSLLTGVVAAGVGGSSSTGPLTLRADSDNSGADGDISIMPGSAEALRFKADGRVTGTKSITGESLLSEFAVPDDGLNDSVGIQNALNALAAGTIHTLVVDGEYKLTSPVSKSFNLTRNVIRIVGRGANSIFHIATGTGATGITLTNAQSLSLEGFNLRGTPGVSTDAKIPLLLASNTVTVMNRINFFGLASAEAGGAGALKVTGAYLTQRNVNFWGCTGYHPNGVSTMVVDSFQGLNMDTPQFLDHGTLNGVSYSKTGTMGYAWLNLGTPAQENEGIARIINMYADEGAAYAIVASSTGNSGQIVIEGLNNNTNPTDEGFGVAIASYKYARVSQSKFKTLNVNPVERVIVRFFNVGRAVVEGVEGFVSAQRVFADSTTTSLTVRDSVFTTLESNAGATRVESSVISTISGTSQFERYESGKRIFGGAVLPTSYATELRGGVAVTGLAAVSGLGGAANFGAGGDGTPRTYWIVAVDVSGRRTTISAPFTIANGWSTLNIGGGAWHNLTWSAVPGAVSYDILRDFTTRKVTSVTGTSFQDEGETYSAYTPPTDNETASVAIDGSVTGVAFKIGAVMWTSGAGAPTGSCTAGSMYTRTDGGTGTSFYVCEATVWVAK
ncbi:MAG: cadherin-like domain-containing protein [Acidobacteria bacterium]|nr:cadherin-like domain-containing protein [Acidobacteriota bacterium]